jgi:hypothetical protein
MVTFDWLATIIGQCGFKLSPILICANFHVMGGDGEMKWMILYVGCHKH